MNENSLLSTEQRRAGQRYALIANLFLQTTFFIVVGSMMMLFANDVLGFSPKKIAAMLALSSLLAILRIPLLPVIRSLGKVRTLLVTESVRFGVVVALLCLPAQRLGFTLYLVLLLIYVGAAQLGMGAVWQPLLRDITTEDDRGRFFARMRLSFTVIGLLLIGAVSTLIGPTVSERQYKVLLMVAAATILHRLFWTSRIPELRSAQGPTCEARHAHRHWLHIARTSPLLRRPLVIDLLLILTCLPVFVLYLRQMLHIPSNLLSTYVFMVTLGGALSYLSWGHIADRIGFRPMMAGLLWLAMAVSPMVLFLAPMSEPYGGLSALGGRDLLTVAVLWLMGLANGAVGAGIGIASTSIQHHHVDSADSLEAMSLHSLAVVATGSVAAYFSGWFLEEVALPAGTLWELGAIQLDWVKVYLVAAVPALYLLALPQVSRLPALNPYYGIADFFSAILTNPVKNIMMFRGARPPRDREGTDDGTRG